jgi:hypothetical protein
MTTFIWIRCVALKIIVQKNRNSFLLKNNNMIMTHPNTPKQCKNIHTNFGISFIRLIPKHSYDVSWRGRLNVTGTIGQT